jgi:hypothetical protein
MLDQPVEQEARDDLESLELFPDNIWPLSAWQMLQQFLGHWIACRPTDIG